MEAAQKTFTYQAIRDVLELLNRTNEMLALHRAQDTLAIAGYEQQREQFLVQLAELLVPFGVEIIYPSRIV